MQKKEKRDNFLTSYSQRDIALSSTLKSLNIDIQKKKCVHEFSDNVKGINTYINSIFITKDGKYVSTGNGNKTAKLWNLYTGKCFRKFERHNRRVACASVTTDGKYLVTSSWDGTACLWIVQTGECIRVFVGHQDGIRGHIISDDDKFILTTSFDRTVKLWHIPTGRCVNTFEGHKGWIRPICLSSDGNCFVTGSGDGTACLWDLRTGRKIRSFDIYHRKDLSGWFFNGVLSVHLSTNGRALATGSGNGKVHIWDVATGKCTKIFDAHPGTVNSVRFSSDGKHLISAGEDKLAKLWNLNTGRCIRVYEWHNQEVQKAILNSNSQLLVTAGNDNTVRFWKTFSGEQLAGFYDLKDGFLWFTPPDEAATSGWFWTDRPELIRVMKCNEDGSEKEILADKAPERITYINTYNRQDMVMNRLNDYEQYKRDLKQIMHRCKVNKLINQGVHQYKLIQTN